MSSGASRLTRAFLLVLVLGAVAPAVASPTTPRVAAPAPPSTVVELGALVEQARQRFVARDLAGVLANVADDYRSGGLTKAGVRQQLVALYALYDALRARVRVDRVDVVDGNAWVYTSGEIAGHLPFVGWVTVLTWQGEPEVARRQGTAWRLVGFQD
jgi:hypothetical protein